MYFFLILALIIEADDVGMVPSKNESQFVFWIGSKQISEVYFPNINKFLNNFILFRFYDFVISFVCDLLDSH